MQGIRTLYIAIMDGLKMEKIRGDNQLSWN